MSASTAPAIPHHDAAHDPNLRTRAKGSWALYDFANTIFSFAIVSNAIGLWLTDDSRFGPATGQAVLSIAIIVSVGINAIVSPVLGALSDRGGRRLPFLLAFSALCIAPTAVIGISSPVVGVLLFILANFSYQAALIYYDASIKLVSTPATRGPAVGHRDGHRVLRDGVRRAADRRLRGPGRGAVRARGAALRPVRDPAVRRREGAPGAARGTAHARHGGRVVGAALDHDPPRARGARPAALPRRPVLLLGRREHRHRRDGRRRGGGRGADRPDLDARAARASRSWRS